MKILITASEEIFGMSKIVKKYAIPEIVNLIGKFVYFSTSNSSHGPRIKFYGGTKATSTTRNAPSLAFTTDGECTIELDSWMDKKNCPNVYNQNYIDNLEKFVKLCLPVLLLVWFEHLDEADALEYFHGNIPFEELLTDIDYNVPTTINNLNELDQYCRDNDYYKF